MVNSTILIVDDEEDIRLLLSEILKNEYNVIACGSLEDARKLVKDKKVDIVLLDIDLPDGSGFDLIRYEGDGRLNDKVVVVSAHKGAEQLKAAEDLGIMHFFEKPIDLAGLTRTIDQLSN